jgi:HSP20 family protein
MAITLRDPFQALDRFNNIESWSPMRDLVRVRQEMNQLFDRLSGEGGGWMEGLSYAPSIEMEETDEAIILKLETPGMEAKDLDIDVTNDTVTIRGERETESKTEEKSVIRSEFHYGKFERMVQLSAPVKNTEAKAEYKDGLLRLVIPKAESIEQEAVKVNIE